MSANAGTKGKGGMEAFDQLPKTIREALHEFPLCMSAEFALKALRSGKSETQLLEMLRNHPVTGNKYQGETS